MGYHEDIPITGIENRALATAYLISWAIILPVIYFGMELTNSLTKNPESAIGGGGLAALAFIALWSQIPRMQQN